jgi:alanine racemase
MDGHFQAVVDLDAIASNVAKLADHAHGAQVMAVIKSDGYGHGMIPTAAAALAGGATWLGAGLLDEAIELRRAGFTAPVLSLFTTPGGSHREAIELGIDLSVGSVSLLGQITAAARQAGRPAGVHLKADTGMSRGGAPMAQWPDLVAAAVAEQAAGRCEIVGIWSHLACADMPGHPSVDAQLAAFHEALDQASRAGARPAVRHLANTAAVLTRPDTCFDLVRPGGGVTGLCTLPGGAPPWLRPAMTVRTELVQVKRVPPGSGVSYGHRYHTAGAATLGLIPLGYNEGVPREAGGIAQVQVRGCRWTIAGSVCMNQLMIDAGDASIEEGDEVIVFGPGDGGEPTAQEWADGLGTISYDIVTRFAARSPKTYLGAAGMRHCEGFRGVVPPDQAGGGPAGGGLAGGGLAGGESTGAELAGGELAAVPVREV